MQTNTYLYFLLALLVLIPSENLIKAEKSFFNTRVVRATETSSFGQKPHRYRQAKKKKKPSPKGKREPLAGAVLFWWVFMPLAIVGLFLATFLIPLPFLWWAALGLLFVWAGVSGIVFFPIQYFGLPLGIAGIIIGLIVKDAAISFILLSLGGTLFAIALFAFAFMALMFTIGTRKHQPK